MNVIPIFQMKTAEAQRDIKAAQLVAGRLTPPSHTGEV